MPTPAADREAPPKCKPPHPRQLPQSTQALPVAPQPPHCELGSAPAHVRCRHGRCGAGSCRSRRRLRSLVWWTAADERLARGGPPHPAGAAAPITHSHSCCSQADVAGQVGPLCTSSCSPGRPLRPRRPAAPPGRAAQQPTAVPRPWQAQPAPCRWGSQPPASWRRWRAPPPRREGAQPARGPAGRAAPLPRHPGCRSPRGARGRSLAPAGGGAVPLTQFGSEYSLHWQFGGGSCTAARRTCGHALEADVGERQGLRAAALRGERAQWRRPAGAQWVASSHGPASREPLCMQAQQARRSRRSAAQQAQRASTSSRSLA